MLPIKNISLLLAMLFILAPIKAHAFWGNDSDKQNGLNLDSGYDANTVTTVTGRIISVLASDDRHNARLAIESGGTRAVVVLGPQPYWAEHGIALKAGDDVTVRGSKAQGTDGVVYILAQKVTDSSQQNSVSLRNDAGRPAWAGSGMGNGAGRMNSPPARMRQQTPGRMGGGRMGR